MFQKPEIKEIKNELIALPKMRQKLGESAYSHEDNRENSVTQRKLAHSISNKQSIQKNETCLELPNNTSFIQPENKSTIQLGKRRKSVVGKNPYGRDVGTFSLENLLVFLYDLLDFISIGLMEDLTRLINLHGAYNTRQASPFRLIETWLRFIFRVLSRSTIGYFLFHLFPPGVLGIYFTMLIVNILNWFYENLLIIFGEFAYHENPRSSSSRNILRYLRYVEGVEPESADYPVVRRSGRRTSSSAGHTMGTSEGLPGGQLSAQQASGGLWRWVSRSFGYEWGHRQADSHRGPNVASNFGSESLGANSQEMVDEKFALDLNRTNPGQVRRRNFALRHVGTLADRVRRTTIFLLGNALISAVIRSDRSPMTTVERTNLEGDYEQQRDIIVGFNLRNALIIPLFTLIIAYIIRFLTG